jgi:hypothetical protein
MGFKQFANQKNKMSRSKNIGHILQGMVFNVTKLLPNCTFYNKMWVLCGLFLEQQCF